MSKDIVLTVDYHHQNMEIRWLDGAAGEERRFKRPTSAASIGRVLSAARRAAAAGGGRVVWIMESTSGWARVKGLVGEGATFLLANVLQMPLPPKARRRKTDKIDTARIQREYLAGHLPLAYQPSAALRQVRRLVDARQDLIERRTTLRNWVWHYLSHETWQGVANLWSARGMERLRKLPLARQDRLVVDLKLAEMEQIEALLARVDEELTAVYRQSESAQRLDEVRGIAPLTAVSMLAYIGPIERFKTSEELISYAGLAPGVHQSDGRCYGTRIGGGGTHSRLRYFVMQSTRWLKEIDRYRPSHQRVLARRGKKVARVVVARMFLRSVHRMLRTGQAFDARPEAKDTTVVREETATTAA